MRLDTLTAAEAIVAEARALTDFRSHLDSLWRLYESLPDSNITVANFGAEAAGCSIPSKLPNPLGDELRKLFRRRLAECCRSFVTEAIVAVDKRLECLTLPEESKTTGPAVAVAPVTEAEVLELLNFTARRINPSQFGTPENEAREWLARVEHVRTRLADQIGKGIYREREGSDDAGRAE